MRARSTSKRASRSTRETTGSHTIRTRPTTGSFRRRRNRRTTARIKKTTGAQLRWLGTALSWLIGTSALGGAGMGIHYGWQCLRASDRLQVDSIEVLGSQRASWGELEAYTGIHVGDPILTVDLDAAAIGLRRHPWIDKATVRRRLPDHVALELVEHEPRMLVSLGEVYIASSDGQLFKRVAAADGVVLPLLTGLGREDTAMRPEAASAVIREGIALSAAASESAVRDQLGVLEELHWDQDLGWSLVMALRPEAPLRIHVGHDPVSRIDLAMRAMRRISALERLPRVIWADGAKNPSRVHVSFRAKNRTTNKQTLIAKAGD